MTTDTTTDPELERLLAACCTHAYFFGSASNRRVRQAAFAREDAACERLLAHIAARYVRRDRLVPDEWDNLDATAPDPPIVAGPLSRVPVTIRVGAVALEGIDA